jgi:pimeloyl-ACP methyl ester carboxylesterase
MTAKFTRTRLLRAAGATAAGTALLGVAGRAEGRAARSAQQQPSILEVPGAALYYETYGSGPLMLMIPGATGSADGFRAVTEHLAADYTVVIYDRRGFSRSQLRGAQDYERRLETDADDARRLIEHLSGEPATVFGSSSGATVALEVLTHHPPVVRTLVPYEPPVIRQLPDGGREMLSFFYGLYDLYRQSGTGPAEVKFRERALSESDRRHAPPAPGPGAPILVNTTYWFERELRQYPPVDLDLRALRARAERIVPVVGRESRGYPAHEATMGLARRLHRDVTELPGGHLGHLTQPAEFARELLQALALLK